MIVHFDFGNKNGGMCMQIENMRNDVELVFFHKSDGTLHV